MQTRAGQAAAGAVAGPDRGRHVHGQGDGALEAGKAGVGGKIDSRCRSRISVGHRGAGGAGVVFDAVEGRREDQRRAHRARVADEAHALQRGGEGPAVLDNPVAARAGARVLIVEAADQMSAIETPDSVAPSYGPPAAATNADTAPYRSPDRRAVGASVQLSCSGSGPISPVAHRPFLSRPRMPRAPAATPGAAARKGLPRSRRSRGRCGRHRAFRRPRGADGRVRR